MENPIIISEDILKKHKELESYCLRASDIEAMDDIKPIIKRYLNYKKFIIRTNFANGQYRGNEQVYYTEINFIDVMASELDRLEKVVDLAKEKESEKQNLQKKK